jgi:hypothetical protein
VSRSKSGLDLPLHELVEAADRAVGRSVLVEERELLFLELAEEVSPGDFFQLIVLWLEIEPQYAGLLLVPSTLVGFAPRSSAH